jgi:hypothetical protein
VIDRVIHEMFNYGNVNTLPGLPPYAKAPRQIDTWASYGEKEKQVQKKVGAIRKNK